MPRHRPVVSSIIALTTEPFVLSDPAIRTRSCAVALPRAFFISSSRVLRHRANPRPDGLRGSDGVRCRPRRRAPTQTSYRGRDCLEMAFGAKDFRFFATREAGYGSFHPSAALRLPLMSTASLPFPPSIAVGHGAVVCFRPVRTCRGARAGRQRATCSHSAPLFRCGKVV